MIVVGVFPLQWYVGYCGLLCPPHFLWNIPQPVKKGTEPSSTNTKDIDNGGDEEDDDGAPPPVVAPRPEHTKSVSVATLLLLPSCHLLEPLLTFYPVVTAFTAYASFTSCCALPYRYIHDPPLLIPCRHLWLLQMETRPLRQLNVRRRRARWRMKRLWINWVWLASVLNVFLCGQYFCSVYPKTSTNNDAFLFFQPVQEP